MTDIDPARRRTFDESITTPSAPGPRGSSTPPAPPRRAASAALERLPTAAEDAALAAFVQNVTARSADPHAAAKAKLDALRDSFSGPYVVDGQAVRARPMFRMNGTGFNQARMLARRPELQAIAARAGVGQHVFACQTGRAAPEQLVKVTQALIDAGKLPPPPGALDRRIREMQWAWGIGVDCAGYTARAAVAVHGAKARPLLGDMTDRFAEMTRDRARFERVPMGAVRPGDVIHLDPPRRGEVGHNVIVHAHAVADDARRAELSTRGGAAATFLAGAGPFHVLDVDSSWGADDGRDYGGFRRDTWIFDEGSRRWGYFDPRTTPATFLVSERGPADEPFAGAFRPKGVK